MPPYGGAQLKPRPMGVDHLPFDLQVAFPSLGGPGNKSGSSAGQTPGLDGTGLYLPISTIWHPIWLTLVKGKNPSRPFF